jgi:hypothetical protein
LEFQLRVTPVVAAQDRITVALALVALEGSFLAFIN